MSEIPAELTHEVGVGKIKLPVGLWIVAGVVGIYIARKATKAGGLLGHAATPAPTDASVNADPLLASTLPSLSAGGAVNVPNGAFNSAASSSITDNEQWRQAADRYLTSQGYDALAASTAIALYLNGDPLTAAQAAMVEKALRYLGPTPEPVTPGTIIPAPTPRPTPKPTPSPGTHIIASSFPRTLAANANTLTKVGAISNGHYIGKQSTSGAPVYALVATAYGPNTSYEQGHALSSLPNGTGLYTLPQFASLFA